MSVSEMYGKVSNGFVRRCLVMQRAGLPGVCNSQSEPTEGAHMSKFSFAVSGTGARREGMIESDSFVAAVDALGQHVDRASVGDVLEIGVFGFPPARSMRRRVKSGPVWMPAGQIAA